VALEPAPAPRVPSRAVREGWEELPPVLGPPKPSLTGEARMSQTTALENLLAQAGYGKRRAARLAQAIDAAGIPGMSSDDLFAAFTRWRLSSGLTDSALRTMTDEQFVGGQQYEKLRNIMTEMLQDIKDGQQYFNFKGGASNKTNP